MSAAHATASNVPREVAKGHARQEEDSSQFGKSPIYHD